MRRSEIFYGTAVNLGSFASPLEELACELLALIAMIVIGHITEGATDGVGARVTDQCQS
jgi:hypothetical protein